MSLIPLRIDSFLSSCTLSQNNRFTRGQSARGNLAAKYLILLNFTQGRTRNQGKRDQLLFKTVSKLFSPKYLIFLFLFSPLNKIQSTENSEKMLTESTGQILLLSFLTAGFWEIPFSEVPLLLVMFIPWRRLNSKQNRKLKTAISQNLKNQTSQNLDYSFFGFEYRYYLQSKYFEYSYPNKLFFFPQRIKLLSCKISALRLN